ncbi:hypothetical protein MHK_008049 [Candidatus Magnetomorum sp. HK-1]|nr:hypothetical protein MHK_008049 [Candidatus Magnetomorum sp. HK-1]
MYSLVPTLQRGNASSTLQRRENTRNEKYEKLVMVVYSRSHAPAWECILDAPASSITLDPTLQRGNASSTLQRRVLLSFPRSSVGMHPRRSSVEYYSRSHAPAWECILDAPASSITLVPTLQRGNASSTLQRRVFQISTFIHSIDHATLERRGCIPTLERGNEKNESSTLQRRENTRNEKYDKLVMVVDR